MPCSFGRRSAGLHSTTELVAIRILMSIEPRMLSDLIEQELASDPELVVLTDGSERGFSGLLAEVDPHAVITNVIDGRLNAATENFLVGSCSRIVLGVEAGDADHSVTLYEMRPEATPLGELAQGTLLEAIRSHLRRKLGDT